MADELRVGVVGCGAFGRQHVRVYAGLPGARLAGVYDANLERARALAAEFATRAFSSLPALLDEIDAASVAVPTSAHAQTAIALLAAGKHVLVEKPLAATLAEADQILAAAAAARRILQVGHLERFNPAVRIVRPLVTTPLFFEVHRLSVFSPRSLDVDVLLDLMIHDLDIVLDFLSAGGQAPAIQEVRAVGLPVLSPRTDIANVRVAFANGCVANFTASRVSTEKVRKLRFFQPGAYFSLDYSRQDAHGFRLQPSGAAMPAITHERLTGPAEEPLAAELAAFLASIRAGALASGAAGGAAGRAALAAALAAGEAVAAHAARVGVAPAP